MRRLLPEYVVNEYMLVERELAIQNKKNPEADKTRNKLVLSMEGPFEVIGVDGNTITLMRDGLKDRVSEDCVV